MDKELQITKILNTKAPTISSEDKAALWNRIETEIAVTTSIPTPYSFNFLSIKSLTPLAVFLLVVLGLGGTAAASEAARPGDFLFPVDRAIENARLAITTDAATKAELKAKFADERLKELRSIIDESSVSDSTEEDGNKTSTSTVHTFSAEADIFDDMTIVRVEINDQAKTYKTSATTREAIVSEIVERFKVEREAVEAVLDIGVVNRPAHDNDLRSVVIDKNREQRVATALDTVINFLNEDELTDDSRNELRNKLATELDGVFLQSSDRRLKVKAQTGKVEVEIKNKGNQAEIKNGNYRVKSENKKDNQKVEIKNKEEKDVWVKFRNQDDEGENDSDDDSDSLHNASDDQKTRSHNDDEEDGNDGSGFDSRSDDNGDVIKKFEVRVEGSKAEVKLEYSGIENEFKTSYTNRKNLIEELSQLTGLNSSSLDTALDLEVR